MTTPRKMTDDKIAEVLRMASGGIQKQKIAEHFGVSNGLITRVLNNTYFYGSRRYRETIGKPAPPAVAMKERQCLMCRKGFPSSGSGHRICNRCRSNSDWQQPAVLSGVVA